MRNSILMIILLGLIASCGNDTLGVKRRTLKVTTDQLNSSSTIAAQCASAFKHTHCAKKSRQCETSDCFINNSSGTYTSYATFNSNCERDAANQGQSQNYYYEHSGSCSATSGNTNVFIP